MKPTLPIEYLRECFLYNPSTGILTWKNRPLAHFPSMREAKRCNTRNADKPVGTNNGQGYLVVGLTYDGQKTGYRVHRVIWAITFGEWPSGEVDHINGDRSDNRAKNLRLATGQQNKRNSGLRRDNTSGIKGVSLQRGKWVARIRVDGKLIILGSFETDKLAQAAYRKAATKHHGEFANAGSRPINAR